MTSRFSQTEMPRATRFALATPLRFRGFGQACWKDAVTVNMSHTGVLFSTFAELLPVGDQVEFRMRLPPIRGRPGAEVYCTGHVARASPGRSAADAGSIAVAISRYTFTKLSETPVAADGNASGRPELQKPPQRGEGR